MNFEQGLVLAFLAAAVGLFISNRIRPDLVALLVLLGLILSGLLTVGEAFQGFASPAVVTVWAVFIISGALTQSGIADTLAEQMTRVAGREPRRLLLVIMLTAGLMSAFMNNVGAVAILLPAVMAISRQQHISPAKLLMPLAFAALLGGNLTLIGTPPNILAASIMADYGGVPPFGFFDFLPTGALVLGAGIVYMLVIGFRLLPDHAGGEGEELVDRYPMRDYLTEMEIMPGSSLIGQTVTGTDFGARYDLNIIRVRHEGQGEKLVVEPLLGERPLQAGDVLLLAGELENILSIGQKEGLSLAPGRPAAEGGWLLSGGKTELLEIAVAPRSPFAQQTIKEMDFRARFGLTVLALRHHGEELHDHLGDVPLDVGDTMLVQGTPEKTDLMRRNGAFLVLDAPHPELRRTEKAPLAAAILLLTLILITTGWLAAAPAMLTGAVLMVLSRVLTMEEAYAAIDWQSVFLIAGMLPLGIAMEETGTARLLGEQLVELVGGWGPLAVLAGLSLLTMLLTEVISNAAATVLMVPLAIDAALASGAQPEPFIMATVIAASTSFLMPIGHQVNIIIMAPGGYRFADYTRLGLGLNLLILALLITVLPLIWPL